MPSPGRSDEPASLPLWPPQPVPVDATAVPVIHRGEQVASSLARVWASPADVAACRLCPAGRCVARGLVCHMVVMAVVTPRDAWLYSTADCEWVNPAPPSSAPALARTS